MAAFSLSKDMLPHWNMLVAIDCDRKTPNLLRSCSDAAASAAVDGSIKFPLLQILLHLPSISCSFYWPTVVPLLQLLAYVNMALLLLRSSDHLLPNIVPYRSAPRGSRLAHLAHYLRGNTPRVS